MTLNIQKTVLAALLGLGMSGAQAAFAVADHVTDGSFGFAEWSGPTVAKQFFPVAGQTGGAYLYVDQGRQSSGIPAFAPALSISPSPDTLYLMYDYVNSNAPGLAFNNGNSFFDVFFEVKSDNSDYLVRINPGTNNFAAYERTHGSRPPTDAQGSFIIDASWTALSPADLSKAQFRTAIGESASPDSPTPHLMAEFQLSIDNNGPTGRGGGDGLYDPAPAFWSASVKGVNDPPISSGIFSLSPSGTTSVTPVIGPNGGPVSIPIASVPEPSTLLLLAGGLGVVGWSARRQRAHAGA